MTDSPITEPGGGAWAVVKDCNGDAWVRGEEGAWMRGRDGLWSAYNWDGMVSHYGPLTVVREGVGTDG